MLVSNLVFYITNLMCCVFISQEVHSQYSFIKVPKVFMNLTSKRVLTMEWIVGENPNDLLAQAKEFGKENNGYLERKRLEAKGRLFDMVCTVK